MIPRYRLEKLTEDEVNVLLYVVNECKCGDNPIEHEYLPFLRIPFVFQSLNDMATKIKPENVTMLQHISDKLTNP